MTNLDMSKIEARFEPVHAQYKALEKFEVTISQEEQGQIETLQSVWATLRQTIVDTEQTIKTKKVKLKSSHLIYMDFELNHVTGTFQNRSYEVNKRVCHRRRGISRGFHG